ncbi:MAG: UDP-3-O-(3-hydroxymyristoyl)glucosamine N-acyltransferase [Alphaproteobacteria bacterium]|nr:UDP-3-O-(3-hydroxymyristoyl)glucosamine N-acyltransferase [Alphaproteobacteria bacterium]
MKQILQTLFGPRANKTNAGALAEKFGLELRGDAKTEISGIAPIADAKPGQLTFYSTEKNAEAFRILPIETLHNTKASVIVLQPEQVNDAPKCATLLITDSPRNAMRKILGEIYREKPRRGISQNAHIESGVFFRDKKSVYVGPFAVIRRGAVIESNVVIESGAFVGAGAQIGANTFVGQNAFIDNATIGADCVIYNGASIGKDGFGFTREDGKNVFIPHVGRVILGERVSVGACSCIDRGLMSDTRVGDGTKIDNQCQIAHGVIIGKECFLAAQTGIAGGVVAGDRVLFGGKVGIANKVQIGDDAEIGANSGVFRNIPAGERIMGYPATNAFEYMKMHAWTRKQMKGDKK